MIHPPEHQEVDAPDDLDEGSPTGPVWDKLRAQHAALAAEVREPLVLEVPGYDGLWIRYRYVPLSGRNKKALAKIRALKDPGDQQFWALVALVQDACDEILVANPDDPRADKTGLAPLCDEGEPPIRFDRILARGLGWKDAELLGARAILRRLFGDEKGDYRLQAHAVDVAEWIAEDGGPSAEEFAGK